MDILKKIWQRSIGKGLFCLSQTGNGVIKTIVRQNIPIQQIESNGAFVREYVYKMPSSHLVLSRPLLFGIDLMYMLGVKYGIGWYPLDPHYMPHVLSPFTIEMQEAVNELLIRSGEDFKTKYRDLIRGVPKTRRYKVYERIINRQFQYLLDKPDTVEYVFKSMIYYGRLAILFHKDGAELSTHYFVGKVEILLTEYNRIYGAGMYIAFSSLAYEIIANEHRLAYEFQFLEH